MRNFPHADDLCAWGGTGRVWVTCGRSEAMPAMHPTGVGAKLSEQPCAREPIRTFAESKLRAHKLNVYCVKQG